jgi:hypothetical protein
MTPMATTNLKPNDKVLVTRDSGEYYADYPAQTILSASQGSIGRIVPMDEFKKDFIRRLGRHQPSRDQQQAYIAHFAVVEQAMANGLQYPVRFEKVEPPANRSDLLLSTSQCIQLVDAAAVEKVESGSRNLVGGLFGQAAPKGPSNSKIVWPAAKVHDQAKFTDFELAIIMSSNKPATQQEIDFVYLRYLSTVPHHNVWFRLKQVVAEAAFDIMDTLRFPKHNHAGYSWEEIADSLEQNDPRKCLWYTGDQQNALITAGQKIYQLEQQRGYDALAKR